MKQAVKLSVMFVMSTADVIEQIFNTENRQQQVDI